LGARADQRGAMVSRTNGSSNQAGSIFANERHRFIPPGSRDPDVAVLGDRMNSSHRLWSDAVQESFDAAGARGASRREVEHVGDRRASLHGRASRPPP